MSSLLDHHRASFASVRVLGDSAYRAFGNVENENTAVRLGNGVRTSLKEYTTVVLGAVPFLRQCGLLQLVAFYASKASKRSQHHHAVLADVVSRLRECELTSSLCRTLKPTPASVAVAGLISLDPKYLPILEAEAEAILTWLKRLADAKGKELDLKIRDKKKDREGAGRESRPEGASRGAGDGGETKS